MGALDVNKVEADVISQSKENEKNEKLPAKTSPSYPKSVGFIISNEFCERFNYYGMRTILVLYLTHKLGYNEESATVLFHAFTMLVYICPLMGALIADGWLGKYKTILYLSIVYSIGTMIVAFGAVPLPNMPTKLITILGLLLIAVGTGGIKPCVSAFGGDQFKLPEQSLQLAKFFSLFYFAVNAGSMISTAVTPILRANVHCFGEDDCFPLAFGVPAVLMIISVLIFMAGKRLYACKPPAGNMTFGVAQCLMDAFKGWRRHRHEKRLAHFLDYAEPTVGAHMVQETKTLVKILRLYLPFPIFWALFDQQGSRWTFQATRMDGNVWGYPVKPDQMQAVNPLLILTFLPLFDYVIYPLLSKIGIRRPLQKLTIGGLLAALSFVLSACLELRLELPEPESMPMSSNVAHLRLYNGLPCSYEFISAVGSIESERRLIEPLDKWAHLDLFMPESKEYKFVAKPKQPDAAQSCPNIESVLRLQPGQSTSYFMSQDQMHEFADGVNKSLNLHGAPLLRLLINIPQDEWPIQLFGAALKGESLWLNAANATELHQLAQGKGELLIKGQLAVEFELLDGGLYSLLVQGSAQQGYTYNLLQVVPPTTVSILWQLPQIAVITGAEIMFSVTGLEFSFTQAPASMKSVLQACWLLSVAVGNMIVVVIAEFKFFSTQSAEFALFAGIMLVDLLFFLYLSHDYEYEDQMPQQSPKKRQSIAAESSSNDDKRKPKRERNNSVHSATDTPRDQRLPLRRSFRSASQRSQLQVYYQREQSPVVQQRANHASELKEPEPVYGAYRKQAEYDCHTLGSTPKCDYGSPAQRLNDSDQGAYRNHGYIDYPDV